MVDIHLVSSILVIINNAEVNILALAGVAHWIECEYVNQRVAGSIPSRAHAWVVGQVPSMGCVRGNYT